LEWHHQGRRILFINTVDRVEYHRTVLDRTADRTDSVTRPASPLNDVGIIMIVLAFYLLAPTPLLTRGGPALFVSVGFLIVLWLVRHVPAVIV